MIISFGVLLLFVQDMREWIHNSQKRQGLKKKALSHTHPLSLSHTHTHKYASTAHLSASCFILITTLTAQLEATFSVLFKCFLGVYTQSPTLLAYCEFKVN